VAGVFVSYNFNDRMMVHNISGLFHANGGRLPGTPFRVERDLSSESDEEIRAEIKSLMQRCKVCLFVVGTDVHNSPWINFEASLARVWKMPIVLMAVPVGIYGPPALLADYEVLPWHSPAAAKALFAAFDSASQRRDTAT
jgi:hypothetical protein